MIYLFLILMISSVFNVKGASISGSGHTSAADKTEKVSSPSPRMMDSILLPGYLALRMADLGGNLVSDIAYNITRMVLFIVYSPFVLANMT